MHDTEPAPFSAILKRDSLGRVTVTREQREELLDAFERSGLKGTQFARAAGVIAARVIGIHHGQSSA